MEDLQTSLQIRNTAKKFMLHHFENAIEHTC